MFVSALEFQPGVPWKGIDRVDPESDPYMTPGSMMGNAGSPNLNDTEHQLLQDNTGQRLHVGIASAYIAGDESNVVSCHFVVKYITPNIRQPLLLEMPP